MSSIRKCPWLQRWCLALACLVAVHGTLGVAQAAARLAERVELRALGLLDAVICHSDPADKANGSPTNPNNHAGHGVLCDCCLTGCGATGPAGPPSERGALLRPLLAINVATRIALDVAHLRCYLTERTGSPRSPPTV